MPIDVESIFKGRSQTSWSFLTTNGQGCYIPAYQRPYSWSTQNVDRLIDDVVHGLNTLKHREATITFLGTLITIHDIKYKTIQPIYRQEVPSRVSTIIDGQQRLCTFIMFNMAMHDIALSLLQSIRKSSRSEFIWLGDQLEKLKANLWESLVLDMKAGDARFRNYPRIVRSYDDAWSKRPDQAKYESPIARLIWTYFLHAHKAPSPNFKYEGPRLASGDPDASHQTVVDVFKGIQKKTKAIVDGSLKGLDFPSPYDLVKSKPFVEGIWNREVEESAIIYLREEQGDHLFDGFSKGIRLLVLAKYFSERVAFTVVTTDNEDDAFDMFEALNTTGEPLTAFETFKPKVIEAESVEKYENSESRKHVRDIETYLEHFQKAEAKQVATSEMLLPFALAETGEKLPNKLNAQRKYLRDRFDHQDLASIEQKRAFLRRMSHLSTFMLNAWKVPDGGGPTFGRAANDDQETLVGFDLLRKLKHHITIAPLSRFFSEALLAANENGRKAQRELLTAVRCTVAFSVLWRSAFGGTNNIDSRFRSIVSELGKKGEPPLAFSSRHGIGAVSLPNYRRALKRNLEREGILKFEDWLQKATKTTIYKANKELSRYLLFLASHDAVSDPECGGLIVSGRSGIAPLLNLEKWNDNDYFTVEHIAPQSAADDWDSELYPDSIHTLGNLVLLPQSENTLASDRPWPQKRALYRTLSANTPDEFEQYKLECQKAGIALGEREKEILNRASYLPMCHSLGKKSDGWTKEFVEKRSVRLATLAWKRLAPWLELEDQS